MKIITWKINKQEKYITWIVDRTCSSNYEEWDEYTEKLELLFIDDISLYDLLSEFKWKKVWISYLISDKSLNDLNEKELVSIDIQKQLWFIKNNPITVDISWYSTRTVIDISFDWLDIIVWWHNFTSEFSSYEWKYCRIEVNIY